MAKKMLIDASHLEEMRVVIVDGTRLDELDIETSTKKQLKSNIYLAKVARVEPSLQAAFVDYGGNRHGFLAFNEIHPDYYQIPVADREALKQAMLDEAKRYNDDDDDEGTKKVSTEDQPSEDTDAIPEALIETISENEQDEPSVRPRPQQIKRYKIQEVIHRGQVLLVQITKEERGNKGAALTTYLSLAGRYCVLMPNNARGGGISRKITNAVERKNLKSIISDLPLPQGMSVIVRTAGKDRTKLEIKRDYEYLIKTWVQIRDTTMASSAPCLIHEEGNLIKRALRDMYTRDIDEVWIEGEQEYRMAKDFMKMLTPSHAKKVQQYKDPSVPLFFRYQVESQLEAMHNNIVQLRSGAYLVMDQTEALVAIDVNSGRATKERNIEETALKTNLEAADEIARQLRLRDMAGLVVIDFIDMEEPRNNHAVERRMKEALKRDRARIQMGHITGFGLMELSRQRLHSSFLETSYQPCPHCKGKGVMRSTESAAIHTLHLLEEEAIKRRFSEIQLTIPTPIALYVLNQKRTDLTKIESLYRIKLRVEGDDALIHATDYRIERVVRTGDDLSDLPPVVVEEVALVVEEQKQEQRQPQKQPNEKNDPHRNRRHQRPKREYENKKNQNEFTAEPAEPKDSWIVQEDVIQIDNTVTEVIKADALFEEGLKTSQKPAQENDPADEQATQEPARKSRFPRGDRRFQKRRPHRNNNATETTPVATTQDAVLVTEKEDLPPVVEAVENETDALNRPRSPSHRRRMRPHKRPMEQVSDEQHPLPSSAPEAQPERKQQKPHTKQRPVAQKEAEKSLVVYASHPVQAVETHPQKKKPVTVIETSNENAEKKKGWWRK